MSQLHNKQRGFTIVELMISSLVFSIILLSCAAMLVQVGRLYYKGVISSRTQGVTRGVIDEVSRTIQFGKGEVTEIPSAATIEVGTETFDVKAICIGNKRFTILENGQVTDGVSSPFENHQVPHGVWKDTVAGGNCGDNIPDLSLAQPSPDGEELLGQHMRVAEFSITPVSGTTSNAFNVIINVVYGDDDLLRDSTNPADGCRGPVEGTQWCAVSRLETTVSARLE